MNSIENEIHEWAETMSFNLLNHDQQINVLHAMSAEEYNRLYESNKAFSSFLISEKETITPNENSLNILKNVTIKENKKSAIVVFWSRLVPMNRAVAACLLFMILTYAFLYKKENIEVPINKVETIVKTIRDTVYLEMPVVEEVIRTVYVREKKESKLDSKSSQNVTDESTFQKQVVILPDSKGIEKSYGNSPVDVASLEQFKVQM